MRLRTGGLSTLNRREERIVFVVGSPRSGTTFFAAAIGSLPGFVDLTEVTPLKAAIPELSHLRPGDAAPRIRAILERVRLLALACGLRGVEQTPETAYALEAALTAYPEGRALHIVRDGRDVVCSLLELGWLSATRRDADDAGLSYGAAARFWIEPGREQEFATVSDARRAAWAWRRYVSAARSVESDRVFELRYEELVADPDGTAERVAAFLGVSDVAALAAALRRAHGRSIGRYRSDLTPEQLADVEHEAGAVLRELGYPAA